MHPFIIGRLKPSTIVVIFGGGVNYFSVFIFALAMCVSMCRGVGEGICRHECRYSEKPEVLDTPGTDFTVV